MKAFEITRAQYATIKNPNNYYGGWVFTRYSQGKFYVKFVTKRARLNFQLF